jgi:hypothetical protein
VITRQRVQIIPITTSVVHLVQELAKQDKMPDGLKIVTKIGSIIYDSTLIAGVDYTPQNVHHPNHDVQNSDDDDSSDDETYTQSTETTVNSEDDLDYRSETSAPQGEQEWIIQPKTFTILITTFKIEKYERLLLLLPCTHLDLILPRVLLIVTFLGRYLLSAVGLLDLSFLPGNYK